MHQNANKGILFFVYYSVDYEKRQCFFLRISKDKKSMPEGNAWVDPAQNNAASRLEIRYLNFALTLEIKE